MKCPNVEAVIREFKYTVSFTKEWLTIGWWRKTVKSESVRALK